MTHAVLFATARIRPGATASAAEAATPGPAALLPFGDGTVIGRLRTQLIQYGVAELTVLARPRDAVALRTEGYAVVECVDVDDELRAVARLANQSRDRLVLAAGDLVAADTVVRAVIGTGRHRNTALVSGSVDGSPLHPAVHSQRGRLVGVQPSGGEPAKADLRGLLVADWRAVSEAAEGLLGSVSGSSRRGAATGGGAAAGADRTDVAPPAGDDALAAVLGAMVTGTTPVAGQRVPGLPYRRVSDRLVARELLEDLDSVDEEAVRLRLAVKPRDDLFATYAVSTYSPRIVRWAAARGLTPTAITWVSVAVAVAAAVGFAQGDRPYLILGALGMYASFVLDCVDGQLARYQHLYTRFGGWLDAIADRGKEYVVYAGLAVGAARTGVGDVWPLAIAAMVLLTTRHMTDTWYGALQDEAVARRPAGAGNQRGSLSLRLGAALGAASDRVHSNRASVMYWVKRTVPLPIGERWMLIAVATALFDAQVALIALLVWGGVAAAYTLFGRVLRTRHLRIPVMATVPLQLHRDDGPLARVLGGVGRGVVRPLPVSLLPASVVLLAVLVGALTPSVRTAAFLAAAVAAAGLAGLAAQHPHLGSLDWLVPAALRVSEYAVLLLIGYHGGVPAPLLFALCGVLALYHYDLTARLEKRSSPLAGRGLALGWDGRIAVLSLAALIGVVPVAAAVLLGYLSAVLLGGAVVGCFGRRPHGRFTAPQQRNGEFAIASAATAGRRTHAGES